MKTTERTAAREKEARAIADLKLSLAKEHGLQINRKFDIAWHIAWEHGHAAGLDEVKIYFAELAELLKP